MIVNVILEKEDFDSIHDVVFSVTGEKPTNEKIQEIWDELPEDIKGVAIQWGTNDTVFRHNLYNWLTGWVSK
jgi:cell division GTPase FtsZ